MRYTFFGLNHFRMHVKNAKLKPILVLDTPVFMSLKYGRAFKQAFSSICLFIYLILLITCPPRERAQGRVQHK